MARKRKKKKLWSKQSKYKCKDGSEVMMDSTWETIMAMRLDELNVKWKRDENIKLEYRSKTGRKRNYIPDFYLPDYDLYIEVKGYWTDAAKYKMQDVQKRNPVKILILESLESISNVDIKTLELL
jgi:predicted nuclease of restriction endonuclease-like RecB superfamily